MLDFSDAEDQREFAQGPVPAGSIVMVEMEVLQPHVDRRAQEDPWVSVSPNGLRQIYCQFVVKHGTYKGVSFRQNITLPLAAQKVQLTQGQIRACHIGNSQLKAICIASGKPPKCQGVTSLTGLAFPATLKINQRPVDRDGTRYWNNELGLIITPDKENYAIVRNGGEVIKEDGPVTGSGEPLTSSGSSGGSGNFGPSTGYGAYDTGAPHPADSAYANEVPF